MFFQKKEQKKDCGSCYNRHLQRAWDLYITEVNENTKLMNENDALKKEIEFLKEELNNYEF